ncbi:MAG: SIS domain-containing protein [Christensenellales bacterium]
MQEFRYRDVLCDEKTLALFISQSGETADTLFALRHAKAKGAATLAVVNTPLSSIAREADKTVHTRAGTEIAVATTKGYTTQVLCLFAVALLLGKARGTLPACEEHYVNAMLNVPRAVRETLKLDDSLKAAAKSICRAQSVFFIGRGQDYAALWREP